MTLWDVIYTRLSDNGTFYHNSTIQVEADTISAANTEAKVLIGTRSSICRIDKARPIIPDTDPAKRKVQGT